MLVRALKPFRAPHKMVQRGEIFDADANYANDLKRNGLAVEQKMGFTPSNKAAQTPQNKAAAGKQPAAGEDQPLSVSQVAQASLQTTVEQSSFGATRPILRLKKKRAAKQ